LFTGIIIATRGIVNGTEPILMTLCIALLIVVNAGYGGGFSNVPTLLSDHFGMKSISSVHGMCLSAWAIAGLTGNQMASWIVRHTGEFTEKVLADGRAVKVNPVGYQNVLYVTIALYIVAMIVCWTMVGKPHKEEE
jgi:OFA family oxalate/formate antiporter-like MFS transporter